MNFMVQMLMDIIEVILVWAQLEPVAIYIIQFYSVPAENVII